MSRFDEIMERHLHHGVTFSDKDRLYADVGLLLAEFAALREERNRYIKAFQHYYVAGKGEDINTCGKCGLYLLDKIHIRAADAMKDSQ